MHVNQPAAANVALKAADFLLAFSSNSHDLLTKSAELSAALRAHKDLTPHDQSAYFETESRAYAVAMNGMTAKDGDLHKLQALAKAHLEPFSADDAIAMARTLTNDPYDLAAELLRSCAFTHRGYTCLF